MMFERETLLDMVVNFVPMVILGTFIAVYLMSFRPVDVATIVGITLIGVTGILLVVLTYEMGKKMEGK